MKRNVEENGRFTVGEWTVEPSLDRISRGDERVSLQPQVMDLLTFLAHHHREVISTDELLTQLWQDRIVTKASIYSSLKQLRDALGDDAQNARYIRTIPKRGYQLIADVEFQDSTANTASAAPGATWRESRVPSKRLQTMAGIVILGILTIYWVSLQQMSTGEYSPREPARPASIAVLPFTDMSPKQDQGWFCDGIAEEILNDLAQVPGLKVSGRTSSFAFRDASVGVKAIGETLGVEHLLEGSVRKDSNRIRVTAQLIRAEDGFHVWSREYDRNSEEILDVQDDIAGNIASVLQLELSGSDGTPDELPIYPTHDAYELYLQAQDLIRQNTKNSLASAVSRLKIALEKEPEFVDAHVAIAKAYDQLTMFSGYFEPGNAYVQANALIEFHVDRALELDPNHAGAWVEKSGIYTAHDPEGSEALERALSLNPSHYEAHLALGINSLSTLAPWLDALKHIDRAVEIEPLSIEAATLLVTFLAWAPQRWEEAETILANLERREPNSADVLLTKAMWLINPAGRPAEAIPILEKILLADPDHSWARSWLTKAWYMLGEFDRAYRMPWGVYHWRYVLSPDREESLRQIQKSQSVHEDIDFGRRIVASYALVMLRDWQGAVDLLSAESGDIELFTRTYCENFVLNESPALSLATAYRALGDLENFERFARLEQKAVNIRTGHGRLHNYEYSRTMARLFALRGNDYEALLELERLVKMGPIDPRTLIHPAFDDLRDDPRFLQLEQTQRDRVNGERHKLDLRPLEPDNLLYPETTENLVYR